ncbi:MAG: LysR family transcriptional regulator [Silvanigrellaceae bacterium]|nr:LysR family transcriptional regulator [Silvanigrellaceae bacterium]
MQELQDIYRLQAFVTVVEAGSLSAAVNKLYITQPALSTRLRLLEESLGCILLERDAKGVRPTGMGKLVYEISKDILKRMHLLQKTVKNHHEIREGW